ncbi:glycosyl transferase 2 family protein [[Clostridium] bifermentans ATCC 638]|uniref:Glycosyl transferase 2 family protein n=1 Tax=Paraclostridium bifermentans ATCC 638 = DSM 14991 TaxID=1233171 RepID=T4VS57_PARBF|nr:glycosyltransferase [Paraclostridium bifermentans]EQK43950.1 glycosyl transferase 2 family protein [[Clostridium] bifermentans ATCC 638] [Paraclostridium bifermentans ATCC 638 = DSM 14991]UAG17773.1 glycosyltransferase [Paraclostridium bifermentans]
MNISIIMPTYNDAESIKETLESISGQTYKNWQLIIINDGSTDNVESVINSYKLNSGDGDKIEYYYQNNQDQLNAISNVLKYIKGDYVYILHSDDLLPSNDFFEKMVKEAKANPDIDAFIGDLTIIDEESNISGTQSVNKYKNADKSLSKLMLWLGRNLYVDVMFAKKEVFITNVKESYLTWNIPFWTRLGFDKDEVLNVKNVDFPILKYRVHGGNYINNEIGKLNVINGELRTLTRLMKYYKIPFYKAQFYIYRIANKLKFGQAFNPVYFKKEENKKGNIIKFVVEKRFDNEYKNNSYLNGIVNFYMHKNKRPIYIEKIDESEFIYKGKDMRLFNKRLLDDNLSDLYLNIIKEMSVGFDKIIVKDEEDKAKVIDIIKFLCIYPYVEIEVNK